MSESFSAGTPSGTAITNKVKVKFDYGDKKNLEAVAETTVMVDNKVNVVLTSLGNTSVTPSAKDRTLLFSVTNVGNTPQRYKLEAGPVYSPENVEFSNIRIYLDKDNSGTLTEGDLLYVDPATFGDVQPDQNLKILIVVDVPDNVEEGVTSQYYLMATTVDAGKIEETKETKGVNTIGVDVVFADKEGVVDVVRDGKHSAMGVFMVKSAKVNIKKEAEVVYDPISPEEPKTNKGAKIRYKLTVNVTGEATAEKVKIKDQIPAGTDYVSGTIRLNGNLLTDNEDNDSGKFTNGEVVVNLGDMTKSTPPQVIEFEVVIK